MKTLFITEYYLDNLQGGGERSAYKLIQAIKNKGIETEVIKSDKRFNVTDWKRLVYFPIYSIIHVIKKGKNADIIHCLNATSIYSIIAKPIIRKPFVIHINSYVNLCPKGTLMYKDQLELEEKRMCSEDCTLKTCFDCCKHSRWLGIKETKINRLTAFILWLKYRFNLYLLSKFDHIITISEQAKKVCINKRLKKVSVIYYGAR